jgi:hypothetical protein
MNKLFFFAVFAFGFVHGMADLTKDIGDTCLALEACARAGWDYPALKVALAKNMFCGDKKCPLSILADALANKMRADKRESDYTELIHKLAQVWRDESSEKKSPIEATHEEKSEKKEHETDLLASKDSLTERVARLDCEKVISLAQMLHEYAENIITAGMRARTVVDYRVLYHTYCTASK